MHRRDVISGLVAGTIGAVAGCVGGGCVGGTSVRFEPVDTAAVVSQATAATDDAPEMMADLLARSLEGDEPVVETHRRSPLGWVTHVERNGRFYELLEETTAEGRVSGPEYELAHDPSEADDSAPNDALSFADLPGHDRWRLNEVADYNIENVGQIGFSISFVAGYLDPDEQAESTLAAGVDDTFLDVDGSYPELERTGEGTATARRIRYTTETVAEDRETFVGRILEQRGAELTDPSDEVRSLLEDVRANGGRMDVCNHETDDADEEEAAERRAAVDQFRSRLRSLETSRQHGDDEESAASGDRLEYLEYEGEWYRVSLSDFAV